MNAYDNGTGDDVGDAYKWFSEVRTMQRSRALREVIRRQAEAADLLDELVKDRAELLCMRVLHHRGVSDEVLAEIGLRIAAMRETHRQHGVAIQDMIDRLIDQHAASVRAQDSTLYLTGDGTTTGG
jgi:hypothetical protein